MRRGPIFVLAAGHPSSCLCFLPPVLRRLCQLSREMPIAWRCWREEQFKMVNFQAKI
ncbi:hypothetical protein K5549_006990 [Capra hircus]|uniref:Uncharacterized protein n=1 Tax=Capra hircus TaxID=9925 RepID=A0A452EC66_CAPHI|nr:hypothetical protein K5549_006990 [Capra hircus]